MTSSFAMEAGRAQMVSALERLVTVVADLRHPETDCLWDVGANRADKPLTDLSVEALEVFW